MQISMPGTPVSETIDSGGSLTVPSGETWKVTITASSTNDSNDYISINGVNFIQYCNPNTAYNSATPFTPRETVLDGGDTISADSGISCLVSGFKVQDNVDNTPISTTIDNGSSVTVPTGETWRVTVHIASTDYGGSYLRVDGVDVALTHDDDSTDYASGGISPFKATFTEGQVIECFSGTYCHLGGWKL